MSIIEAVPYCVIGLLSILIGAQFIRSAISDRKHKRRVEDVLDNVYDAASKRIKEDIEDVDDLDDYLDRLGAALELADRSNDRHGDTIKACRDKVDKPTGKN